MSLQSLDFFVSEAISGIQRSSLMAFISIATITVSLIVFGIFLLLTFNLNNLVNFVVSKLEIRVYLTDDITTFQTNDFIMKIRQQPIVESVTFIDKKTAWQDFNKQFSSIDLNDLLAENPLPNTLKIKLFDMHDIPQMITFLKQYSQYVVDISYGKDLANRIQIFSDFAKLSGIVLVLLLSFATLLIIVNTIRLTVIARQDEITIMQLVGATNQFIEWPFLIEGLIFGLMGATFATIFLKFGYGFLVLKFQENAPYFPLVSNSKTTLTLYAIIFATGTCLGVFGAFISVSKSLKQKN